MMTDRDVRMHGRELALAVLCHLESYPAGEHRRAAALLLRAPPTGDEPGEDEIARLAADTQVHAFAQDLIALCIEHRDETDALIDTTSTSWRLQRMDRVDRNVVRLAATELRARADTPRNVVVAEAVRLAARFGSERSASFVNGLVEALATRLRPTASTGGP